MGGAVTGVLRRVGVIGDVHTEDALLERALRYLRGASLDAVLCVGDITDGFNREAHVARCCAALRRDRVITVCGNHDRWAVDREMRDVKGATLREDLAHEALEFLEDLPAEVPIDTAAGLALLCHGLEGDDMASVKPFDRGVALTTNDALQSMLSSSKYRFVINGHTHQRMVRTIEGLTLINAGTLYREHTPGFVVIDFEARHVDFFDLPDEGEPVLAESVALDASVRQ